MSKILVTGANGYIGKAICAKLSSNRIDVLAVVRTKSEINEFGIGDISGSSNWLPVLDDCSTVIHLAARVHIMKEDSSDPRVAFWMVNVEGTANLARQAARKGVKRFIFLSSIGVNGNETDLNPFTEKQNPQPHSLYAISKLEAENELKNICAQSGMEFVIIRPPLVYGSNAPGNFQNLLKFVSKGLPMPLASIDNQRSLISLDNLIDFISICIFHPKAANQVFVVADGEDISTPNLIRVLAKEMGCSAILFHFPVVFLEYCANFLKKKNMFLQLNNSLQIDIGKARDLLNWVPPNKLHDGLRRAAQGYLNEKII